MPISEHRRDQMKTDVAKHRSITRYKRAPLACTVKFVVSRITLANPFQSEKMKPKEKKSIENTSAG